MLQLGCRILRFSYGARAVSCVGIVRLWKPIRPFSQLETLPECFGNEHVLAYAVTRGVEASGACVRMEFFNFVVIGVEMQLLLNTYKIHLYAFE